MAKNNIGEFLNNKLFGKFVTTLNVEDINKRLDRNKPVSIHAPTSYRTVRKDPGSTYNETNDVKITEEGDWEKDDSVVEGVASSAIADVKYDPENEIASVRYVNGDKYYDFSVNPKEMKDFVDAYSKGRHVQHIWKEYNRMPGY